ncbi:hypothetical protein MLD38_040845 [Melastoma candidum]|nr:hypothetical protein MLD38_040845 [Melastoma candidum]
MEKNRSYPGYSGSDNYHTSRTYTRVFGLELSEDIVPGAAPGTSYSFNGPKARDPESKRKKRIASYNLLSSEARLKSTFSSSFKWIKSKFSDFPYSPRDDQ